MKPLPVAIIVFAILFLLLQPVILLVLIELNIAPAYESWRTVRAVFTGIAGILAFVAYLFVHWKYLQSAKVFKILLTIFFSLIEFGSLVILFAILMLHTKEPDPLRKDVFEDKHICIYLNYSHWDSYQTNGLFGFFKSEVGPGSAVNFYTCDPDWPIDPKNVEAGRWSGNIETIPMSAEPVREADSVFYRFDIPVNREYSVYGFDLNTRQGRWYTNR